MEKKDLRIPFPFGELEEADGWMVASYCYIYAAGYGSQAPDGMMHVHLSNVNYYVKATYTYIRDALDKLAPVGIRKVDSLEYVVNLDRMFAKKERFVLLPFGTVRKIAESSKKQRADLLAFYAAIMRTMDGNIEHMGRRYFVAHKSLPYYAKMLGCHPVTVKRWVKELEELGALYVYRVYGTRTANLMGAVEDRKLIDAYAVDQGWMPALKISWPAALNMYSAIVNGNKEYPDEVLVDLKKSLEKYNLYHPDRAVDVSLIA